MLKENFEKLEKDMLSKYYCEKISNSSQIKYEDLKFLLKYALQEEINLQEKKVLKIKN